MTNCTFEEAGSDDDLHAAYMQGQSDRHRRRGDELLAGARALMRTNPSRQGRERAESNARQALSSYASSLNWAEGSDDEEKAHQRMDAAGNWVRRAFGCHLHRENKTYSQRCPVALAHDRVGLSVGGAARRICSLCGDDLSECEHRRGVAYMVPGGSADLGWCRVCLKESGCSHRADEQHRVGVVSIIKEMELQEVSIVGRPAHPDARFEIIGIDAGKLQARLGAAFSPGVPVNCDRCLQVCEGLVTHDEILHG
jgi:hypothetical protein